MNRTTVGVLGVADMAHSRRAALVLDCGHLAPPRGRIEGAPPLVGSYAWCPVCAAFHEVVAVGRHLHAVPAQSGPDWTMTAPTMGLGLTHFSPRWARCSARFM